MTAPCSGQLPAGHPALKAAVSEAIAGVLADHSAREVGRWIGRKGDTASERGNDVDAWPLSELRAMADRNADLDAAVLAYWKGGTPVDGDSAKACDRIYRRAKGTTAALWRSGALPGRRQGRAIIVSAKRAEELLGVHA